MPKKENIHELFNDISPDYDRLNHILSLNIDKIWRKRSVREIIDTDHPLEILDIACGTGDFSLAIAGKMPEGSHIEGLDLSEGMLAIMKDKICKANLSEKIGVRQGDCENLPFNDESFDRISVAFGIRNFENREACLKEMLRVLKPGGKLVILELSLPKNKFVRWLFNIYFLNLLPLIGGRVSGDKAAYRYLPASVLNFPQKNEFKAILSSCGYANVTHKAFTCGICRLYSGMKIHNR